MKKQPQCKRGMFNYDTLTVSFGGVGSNAKDIFTAQAVKVPTYKYTVMETADAGGGSYYCYKEAVEYTEDNAYLIYRDGELIGWMRPYAKCHNIKSELWLIDEKNTPQRIRKFAANTTPPATLSI